MISTLLIIAQIKTFLDRWQDNEFDVLLIWVTLEYMYRGFACPQHGAYEHIFNIDVVRMFLRGLALAYSFNSEAGVNKVLSDLKLPVFIAVCTMSVYDSRKFHIKFCYGMSHQNKLASGQCLWVGRWRLEIRVKI